MASTRALVELAAINRRLATVGSRRSWDKRRPAGRSRTCGLRAMQISPAVVDHAMAEVDPLALAAAAAIRSRSIFTGVGVFASGPAAG